MGKQISNNRWNSTCWDLDCFFDKEEFVISSAFDRDTITLDKDEAIRLRDELNNFLNQDLPNSL